MSREPRRVVRRISGQVMMPRLRDEDRLAVDLLLDRAVTGSNGGGNGNGHPATTFTPVSGTVPEQLSRVQSLLRVLDMLPAEEPPADLLARTMRRVEEQSAQGPSALRPPQPGVSGIHMPHA